MASEGADSVRESVKMWDPPADKKTQMDTFREHINTTFGTDLGDYHALYEWSVENTAEFWGECWKYFEIVHSEPYETVVDTAAPMDSIPKWFEGAKLNFAENLLRYRDDRTAIIYQGEGHEPTKVSYAELYDRVARVAAALRAAGITEGDRVAGYISNCVEAVVVMLATTSIGAIWSSTSPDFGVRGVLDRFVQIEPKIIFSVNAVHYNGKIHDHFGKLAEVVSGLTNLERVVVIPFVDQEIDLSTIGFDNICLFDDFVNETTAPEDDTPEIEFNQLPASQPVYILYSSGTTGSPKCIVHSAGGTLVQHMKELVLHGDLTREDVIFYFTTTGWMMWNWLVSSLAVGATMVLFDGSPMMPEVTSLWDMADAHGVTVFGTSAKYLAALEAKGAKPRETHNLSTVRAILSTGSPLLPSQYDYVYAHVKEDVLLGSITGGTDIISCFAGSNPALPVYRGEIQARNLGMAVYAQDDDEFVEDKRGDLVCIKAFPSMPVFFWRDEDGARYKKAYFERFPGVWCHSDFLIIHSATKGITMLGRSDGTLNPAGVRFGSAELYNVVEAIPGVADSLAIGQKTDGDERVVLFIQTDEGVELDDELLGKIKSAIIANLSRRHVPALILPTADVPYTINGKKVEVAVKRIIHGEEVTERGALRNGDALDLYKDLPALQQ